MVFVIVLIVFIAFLIYFLAFAGKKKAEGSDLGEHHRA